jgi:hypothetical protein
MWPWRKRAAKAMNDPVFGGLRSIGERIWQASAVLPGVPNPVVVRIYEGPTDEQRQLWLELAQRYPTLQGEIRAHLRDFDPQIFFLGDEPPAQPSPDRQAVGTLVAVEVYGSHLPRSPRLNLMHELYWLNEETGHWQRDDEHEMSVMVTDWRIVDAGLEG